MVEAKAAENIERWIAKAGPRADPSAPYGLAASLVTAALKDVGAIDLETWELARRSEAPWTRLQAPVLKLLQSAQRIGQALLERFPRPPSETEDLADLDLAVALDDFDAGMPSPIRDRYELRLSRLYDSVRPQEPATIGPAVAEIAAVIHRSVTEHAKRLDRTDITQDPEALIGEINEIRTKLENALETILAVLVTGLGDGRLHDVSTELSTPAGRVARLRAWSVDLERSLRRVSPSAEPALRLQIAIDVVERAARAREARRLRPHDRAVIQGFRRWARDAVSPTSAEVTAELGRLQVWVRGMRRINDREIMRAHDLHFAQIGLELIDKKAKPRPIREVLERLRGRDEELDSLLAITAEPDPAEVADHLRRIKRGLSPRPQR